MTLLEEIRLTIVLRLLQLAMAISPVSRKAEHAKLLQSVHVYLTGITENYNDQ